MGIAFAISVLVFIIVQVFPEFIISLFDTNEDVISLGKEYLRFIALDYIFVPFVFCMNGLAIGAGFYSGAITATIIVLVESRFAPFAVLSGITTY